MLGGFALVGVAAFLVSSCQAGIDGGFREDPDGIQAEWSPREPAPGDLVELRLSIPGPLWQKDAFLVEGPSGAPEVPRDTWFEPSRARESYTFRIREPGTWTFRGHALWTAVSVAGERKEPVRLVPEDLWNLASRPGQLPDQPPAVAPMDPSGPASPGGQP